MFSGLRTRIRLLAQDVAVPVHVEWSEGTRAGFLLPWQCIVIGRHRIDAEMIKTPLAEGSQIAGAKEKSADAEYFFDSAKLLLRRNRLRCVLLMFAVGVRTLQNRPRF